MSPLLKAALVWILALALPMQALAAATMLHCSHQPAPQAEAAAHGHAGHHGAVATPSVAAHDVAAHPDGDAVDASADGMHGTHGTHVCSACAACVASAALPSAVSVTLPVDSAGAMVLAPASRECSVVLAGLERPPRNPLA